MAMSESLLTREPGQDARDDGSRPVSRSTNRLSRRARHALLTVHIIVSVALLGDVACLLAVAIRGATTSDPQLAEASTELLSMFSLIFGIPLSFATLITGVALGVGTTWGVFRHPWVIAKLAIILTVIAAGALVIGPAESALMDGDVDARARVIAGASYDVVALMTATGLSVFKPGRRRRLQSRA